MSLCSRLLRVVSLACAVVAVSGLAQAQQPAPQQPAPQPPAAQTGAQEKKLPVPAPKDPVVATVNGQPIYLSEVQVLQQALPPQYRSVPLSSVFPMLLDRMVTNKIVVAEAKKNRFDADPAFKRRLAFIEGQVLQDSFLNQELAKLVTQDKLQARYQEKLKSMPAEDEVHARHILVATEQEAKDLLAELKKGASFDKLAREKSTDKASGAEGGDLGWFKRTDMVKEFSDAAFALKKGEMSDVPVKTQFGYHLIKVEDRRQAPPPSFEELSDQIREEVQGEAVKQYLDQLRANGKIEKFNIDGSKVAAAPASPPAAAPPAATPPAAAPSTTGPTAPPPALPNPAK